MKNLKNTLSLIVLAICLWNCAASKDGSARDGSSIEKAIKVRDVGQEYAHVRKVCTDCQLKSQSLVSNGNKHYDVITMTKSDGQEVKYYFDINSFYGKW